MCINSQIATLINYGVSMFIVQLFMWLLIWMLVMAFAEYTIHRWTMHRKKWWLPNWIFNDHAIEHHHHERNDLNIDLPIYNHLLIGSPLIILSYFIGLPCLIAVLSVFCFHSYTWTKIHRGIHDLEENWIMKTKYYEKAKDHHINHHHRPGKNFGVVFLFTDSVFGTKVSD